MTTRNNNGPNRGHTNIATFLKRLSAEDRIKVKAFFADIRAEYNPHRGESPLVGWSILTVPSTGEPYIVRLLYRDANGALRRVVSIRDDKPPRHPTIIRSSGDALKHIAEQ